MAFTYKGLSAQLTKHTVTDSEVTQQIERLRQSHPRIASVKDRATQQGDEVVLDYAGFCDGVQFPGGTAQNQTLVLGSGMFIPGFEEQLLDKVPGEEVTVNVTFPEAYHSPDLAGKAAEFRCTIHEIRINTPYELDDVFAQEVGGCYTLEEFREQMQKSMQEYADRRGEIDLQERLLQQAAETLEVSFTDVELEAAVDAQMQMLADQLAQQGLDVQMYCNFMNTTEQALRADARPSAEAALRSQTAVDKIIELEGLEATEEEINKTVEVVCRQNNMTLEELKPHYTAEFEQAVIRSILTGKVMGLIREAADIAVV